MTEEPADRAALRDGRLLIRPTEAQDIPTITRIYDHHVRHGLGSFEENPPGETEMMERWRAILAAGYPYVVAVRRAENRVLGYAYLSAYRPRPAYRFTVEDSVYVAPDGQGAGVGAVLLAHLIDQAMARGCRQMVAMIGDRDNHGSIRLHEKLGFRQAGHLADVGFKKGRWVDVIIMQRALDPG
ncbi:MAG: N-acetyltransferase family protein [Pseudomonadota bacterium]